MINNILCLSGLYQFSAVHNVDLINHLGYNCQVMGDQHQGSIMLFYQLFHKLKDLFLNGNIQSSSRLICDQQLRVGSQCNSNDNTLAHTTGKLVWIFF